MQLEDSEQLQFPTPFLLIGERSKKRPAMNTSKQSNIYPLFIQAFQSLCQESTHSYALWMSYCFIGFKLIFASNMYIKK